MFGYLHLHLLVMWSHVRRAKEWSLYEKEIFQDGNSLKRKEIALDSYMGGGGYMWEGWPIPHVISHMVSLTAEIGSKRCIPDVVSPVHRRRWGAIRGFLKNNMGYIFSSYPQESYTSDLKSWVVPWGKYSKARETDVPLQWKFWYKKPNHVIDIS